jgi:N-acetylmuramoyl-L-alanine amidase
MRFLETLLLIVLATMGSPQTICIDPGHPSENGIGTKGAKLTEVGVAWKVALRLKELLAADGYKVVLTKSSEMEKVTNKRRAQIANASKAALLLRLHCDAANGSGISSYYPKEAGKVDGITGPSGSVRKESARAAALFHPALIQALQGKHADRGLLTDRQTAIGGKQGALTGSIYSTVPTILVEMAVLTNPKDEAFVASKEGFELLCQALKSACEAAVPKR